MRHCKNGGEHKIGKYFLDGYDAKTNSGYEFHGCPRCYKKSTFNTIKQVTKGYIYIQHTNRINYLKIYVNNLIEMWECDWDKLVSENNQLSHFVKNEKDIRPDLKQEMLCLADVQMH
jgi:hypothetical protein